jgi:hypothetical protein
MQRYEWIFRADPTLHELIDNLTGQTVVTIELTRNGWKWERNTASLMHGGIANSGVEPLLITAKTAAIQDMPGGNQEL